MATRDAKNSQSGASSPEDTSRKPQATVAYEELKRRILDNELAAGFQAMETEIADMLDMSRTPVREALIRLSNEGLVEVRPRHGMRVLPVSAEDMREIYQILTALESSAAALLAKQGVTPEQSGQLRQSVQDMDEALHREDLHAWAAADQRFHWLLVEFCGNRRLQAIVGNYMDQSRRVRMLTLKLRDKPTGSNIDHAALVDAIEKRDPDLAWQVHHQHREKAGRMLVGLLQEYGLTQL